MSTADELAKLAALLQSGNLSQEEFDQEKARLLDNRVSTPPLPPSESAPPGTTPASTPLAPSAARPIPRKRAPWWRRRLSRRQWLVFGAVWVVLIIIAVASSSSSGPKHPAASTAPAKFTYHVVSDSISSDAATKTFLVPVSVHNTGTKAAAPWCDAAIQSGSTPIGVTTPRPYGVISPGGTETVTIKVTDNLAGTPRQAQALCASSMSAANNSASWSIVRLSVPTTTLSPVRKQEAAVYAWYQGQQARLGRIASDLNSLATAGKDRNLSGATKACKALRLDATAEMNAPPVPDATVLSPFQAAMTDYSDAASNYLSGLAQNNASVVNVASREVAAGTAELAKATAAIKALAALGS